MRWALLPVVASWISGAGNQIVDKFPMKAAVDGSARLDLELVQEAAASSTGRCNTD
jgi:hypothetical protein